MGDNGHTKLKCTVCEHEFELPHSAKEGERVTCPNCFAQLMIRVQDGKKQLRCALCKNQMLLSCAPDCERRYQEREKRGFFNIKL